jgi:Zn-dependent peptidase ImmA (M78 family)
MGYNKVQDALIKAFKDSETINKKALYLFFIKENTTHSDIKGHMPFNRQFGFIYAANQSITELTRTMAHELGHAAFRLKHTFSNENANNSRDVKNFGHFITIIETEICS